MVRNALESIKNLDYSNWELAFIDDGSILPGKPIVEEILAEHLEKVVFINTGDSIEDKIRRGGSRIGSYMNSAVKSSDADLAIMLCDDDSLVPDYFTNLDKWFTEHPTSMYCYSHVILFDPFKEKPVRETFETDEIIWAGHKQNRYKNRYNKTRRLNPANSLDSSQVAWRTSCNTKGRLRFPSPKTCNLDSSFYAGLRLKYGQVSFSGFIGQYKGYHVDNLCLKDQAIRSAHPKKRNSIIFSIKDVSDDCEIS
jgi:glycosyltransferase involved in cell wall biosynthesis